MTAETMLAINVEVECSDTYARDVRLLLCQASGAEAVKFPLVRTSDPERAEPRDDLRDGRSHTSDDVLCGPLGGTRTRLIPRGWCGRPLVAISATPSRGRSNVVDRACGAAGHFGVVMSSAPVQAFLGAICAALAVAAVSGCSGSGPTGQPPSPPASSSPQAPSSTTATASSSTTSRPALKDDPVDAAFHAKVETMCLSLLTDKIKHQAPDGFSVTNPDPATFAAAASAIDAQTITHSLANTASSLGSPKTAASSWSAVMADFATYEKDAQASVAAAGTGSVAAFGSTLTTLESVKSTIRDDLRAVGFGNRSSCDQLFAPGGGH